MTSLPTRHKLADLFRVTAEGEKQIEIVRQVLAEKSAFEPYTAFKRIDRDSKNYVSTYDLLTFLRENDVAILERDLVSVFRENNTKYEDKISYTEFLNMVLPKGSGVLRQLATQRETYHVGRDQVLPYEVEYALARVFEKEIQSVCKVELLRANLAERHDFDPVALFRTIDVERAGSIGFDALYIFLKDHDVPASENDVLALLRHTDKDVDGKLNLAEFSEALGIAPVNTISRSKSPTKTSTRGSSPIKKGASPLKKGASPVRSRSNNRAQASKIAAKKERAHDISKDLADSNYISYVSNTAEKSARSRSPEHNRSNNFHRSPRAEDIDKRIVVKRQPITSPVRNSVTKRMQESSGTVGLNELNASTSSSVYQNYVNRTASPTLKESSPLRDYYDRTESPLRRPLSPTRRPGSPLRRPLSPTRRPGSPLRRGLEESPSKVSRVQRFEASPQRRVASPSRGLTSPSRSGSPLRESMLVGNSPSRRGVFAKDKNSPMKGNEEEHLVNALKEQIELDKELENIKVELALRRDFKLLDAFNFFDLEGHGSVTKKDIKDSLNTLEIFPTNDELYLILRRFDKENSGLLRFSDFVDMLTPKEVGYAEILNSRNPINAINGRLDEAFCEQTIYLLKKTLKMIINNEASCESIRQRLNRRPLFNLWEGFKALDKNNLGYVSAYEFKDMLIEHGFFPSQKEVKSLVDRYDKNHDGKVSYSEFIQEITPKSPQKY